METTSEGTSTVGVFPSEAAYDQLLPEIAAVPEEDFMHINTDVPCDVTTVLGALPELKRCGRHPVGISDVRFSTFRQTGALCSGAEPRALALEGGDGVEADVGELASALSEGAGFSAAAGAGAGAAGADRWRGAGGYPKDAGYKAIAIDVQSLAALLESRWSVVRGKAAVTLAELHQHGARASEPLNAIGQKDLAEPVVGEAAVRCKRKALDTEKDAVSDCKNDAGGEGVERWRHRPPSSRSRTR